jgi:hypothetical protein
LSFTRSEHLARHIRYVIRPVSYHVADILQKTHR